MTNQTETQNSNTQANTNNPDRNIQVTQDHHSNINNGINFTKDDNIYIPSDEEIQDNNLINQNHINKTSAYFSNDHVYDGLNDFYFDSKKEGYYFVYFYNSSSNNYSGDDGSGNNQSEIINNYHYSELFLKQEFRKIKIKGYRVINDINKAINSSLILILPDFNNDISNNNSNKRFIKILNNLFSYNYNSNQPLKLFSKIIVYGYSVDFNKFHLELDLFLTYYKHYKIINHPFKTNNYLTQFVQLASVNPNSIFSKEIIKYDKIQFPIVFNKNGRDNSYSCDSIKQLVNELKCWGMTSILHINVNLFIHTSNSNRMFIIEQGCFNYGLYNELFLPTSMCDFYEYNREELILYPFYSHINTQFDDRLIIFSDDQSHLTLEKDNFIPPEIQINFKDSLTVNSFLINYLITPTFHQREIINDRILESFKRPYIPACISIHIRHGDKFFENDLFNFESYYQILKTFYKQHYNNKEVRKIKDIFILTDDQNVIDQVKFKQQLLQQPESSKDILANMTFNYLDLKRSKDGWYQEFDLDNSLPFNDYGLTLFAEAFIASNCQVFIGTMSSNIARLILELQSLNYNNRKKFKKYISLDIKYPQSLSDIPVIKEFNLTHV